MILLINRKGFFIYSFLLLSLAACRKAGNVKPHSYVYVRVGNSDEYSYMEDVEGRMKGGMAELHSNGYYNEQFSLRLPNIKDTGDFSSPGLDNIYFSNGDDFYPVRFVHGNIHISYVDSVTVLGDFSVVLEDEYNGPDTKTVTGSFGINVP